MQNIVQVNFLFNDVPSKNTNEYKKLKHSVHIACNSIRNNISNASYFSDKTYDERLLLRYLLRFNGLLHSDVNDYKFCEDVPVSDIDFNVYTDMSKHCENVDVQVVISKFGPHVRCCDDPSDVSYYNKLLLHCHNADIVSQEMSHVDETGKSCEDDLIITLYGDDCKISLSEIRNELQSALLESVVDKQQFVHTTDNQIQESDEVSFDK